MDYQQRNDDDENASAELNARRMGVRKRNGGCGESQSSCEHIRACNKISFQTLLKAKTVPCGECGFVGKSRWICLKNDCHKVNCGFKAKDHSSAHTNNTDESHCVHCNVTTWKVYCSACEEEVLPESNKPKWPVGLQFLSGEGLKRLKTEEYASKNEENVSENRGSRNSAVPFSVAPEGEENQPLVHKGRSAEQREQEERENLEEKTFGRFYNDRERPTAVPEDLYYNNDENRGLKGLQNLGNTCYMNAALQCLSNCPPLLEYFLHCHIIPNQTPVVSQQFAHVLKQLWSDRKQGYVSPFNLLRGVQTVCPQFRTYQQQDSQEFLRCFLDQLHQGIIRKIRPILESYKLYPSFCRKELRVPVYDWEDRGRPSPPRDNAVNGTKSATERNLRSARARGDCGEADAEAMREESGRLWERGRTRSESGKSSRAGSMSSRSDSYETADSGLSSEQELGSPSVGVRRRAQGKRNRSESRDYSDARQELSPQTPRRKTKSASSAIGQQQQRRQHTTRRHRASPDIVPKKKPLHYRSMVTDVFDGRLLSSVECLTCNHVSETKETFQDLSLPIPNRDQLNRLRTLSAASLSSSDSGIHSQDSSAQSSQSQGWLSWIYSSLTGWTYDWLFGPEISLQDCLGAFFTPDELQGDDMYSCDKCNKLRNGLKVCRLLALPEVLGVHLKRFRHDVMFSSKISTRVTFPLFDLDLSPFVHDTCSTKVSKYDLIGVISHSGGAEGGHYIAYAKNPTNQRWYEFDDSCVSGVTEAQVCTVEAYVLFYQKSDYGIEPIRTNVQRLLSQKKKSSVMKYYASQEWVHKFNTFAEPGPISNTDFLCPHGAILPRVAPHASDFYTEIPGHVWDYLHKKFGGGPVCTTLVFCLPCTQEHKRLEIKRMRELDNYRRLDKESRQVPWDLSETRAINLDWMEAWDRFVNGYTLEPPGPIENSSLLRDAPDGRKYLRGSGTAKHIKLTRDMWEYFYTIYGGGPEVYYQLGPQPTLEEIEEENRRKIEIERMEEELMKRREREEEIDAEDEEEEESEQVVKNSNEEKGTKCGQRGDKDEEETTEGKETFTDIQEVREEQAMDVDEGRGETEKAMDSNHDIEEDEGNQEGNRGENDEPISEEKNVSNL